MEPRNRREADDRGTERSGAERGWEAGGEEQADQGVDRKPATLSAIERQKLAMSARDNIRDSNGRSRRRRARYGTPFVVLTLSLIVAIGVAIVYTYNDPSLLKQADTLLRATVLKIGEPPIESQDPAYAAAPSTQIAPTLEQSVPADIDVMSGQVDRDPVSDPLSDPVATPPDTDPQPAFDTELPVDAPRSIDATTLAEDAPPATDPPPLSADVFSLPVEKLSLHDQPDLFRQLVQLYNAALIENPDNAEAATALQRLEDKAFVELEAAIEAQEMPVADRLFKYAGDLFPGMKEELRYQALGALIAQQKQDAAKVVAEQVSQKPPPRPYINSLSMSLGTLEDSRFVPSDDGTVVMIRIDYSNFSNPPASPGDDTLILRIRAAGNPLTMAEVPVPIHGDRGTKSFTVDTMIKGGGVEYYQLDFMLQGRVLESRIVARTPI